jgi:hypothetical protein
MSFKKFLIIPVAIAFMAVGIGSVNAQVPATLVGVQLATTGLTNPLVAGANDATMARLVLDTTGSNTAVRISSLPLRLTTGNGALTSTLTGCQVVNENTGATLSSGTNVVNNISTGLNNIALDSAIVLQPNTVTTLALRCDIGSNLVTNGTYQFSLNTADVVATDPATGAAAVVALRGVTSPVVVPVPVPTVPVVVPGVPNTGAGGAASTNIMIVLGSLAAASLGLAYARKAAR